MKSVNLQQLSLKLQELESYLRDEWGLRKISGGFVHIKFNYFDEKSNTIYLTCKSGVQNDVENDVTEEQLKMNLKTFELI